MTEKTLKNANKLKELNCFTRLTPEIAASQAKDSSDRYQSNKSQGLLDGVPIAVKDNFCVENIPTTCGSK